MSTKTKNEELHARHERAVATLLDVAKLLDSSEDVTDEEQMKDQIDELCSLPEDDAIEESEMERRRKTPIAHRQPSPWALWQKPRWYELDQHGRIREISLEGDQKTANYLDFNEVD